MDSMELLDQTISILEQDGWCQNQFTNSRGQHCIRGAAYKAIQGITYDWQLADFKKGGQVVELCELLRPFMPETCQAYVGADMGMVKLNDVIFQDQEEVLIWLKLAQIKLKERYAG